MFKGRHIRHIRLIVAFVLGIIIGCITMTISYGAKLEGLYAERETLYYEYNQRVKKIQLLQQDLDKRAQQNARQQEGSQIIKQIQVEIDSPVKFNQSIVKTEVETILKPFLNKSVRWVSSDPALLDTMLKKRLVKLPDKNTVEIRLKYLAFFDSELKVWVSAREISDKDVSMSGE
ncbi:hypothetical protein SAMN05444487_10877 [Marininema mesophilum]|uniref:Uncharacterized protein n=1 Tax=Marininema mesophilum TaxID=1048340 RepID=A0A1H2XX96_9BACL|nr:hypothetical protein [Marininema mesophilum]SDW97208.1 hypothetical protein SAMN05444487_10877 [Marininema mesophilum]